MKILVDTDKKIIDIEESLDKIVIKDLYNNIKHKWRYNEQLLNYEFPMSMATLEIGSMNSDWKLSEKILKNLFGALVQGKDEYACLYSLVEVRGHACVKIKCDEFDITTKLVNYIEDWTGYNIGTASIGAHMIPLPVPIMNERLYTTEFFGRDIDEIREKYPEYFV